MLPAPDAPARARPAAPFWESLAVRGAAPALLSDSETVTYADLAGRVDALAARLGPTRRLVLLEAANDVASVVGYLACLRGGHPVLLAVPGRAAELAATYDPDVHIAGDDIVEARPGTAHALHPDLAQLASTSGSTGSPHLVRLEAASVAANATAIAEALALRPGDVAVTSLPLHYCYGLSVLASHLAVGAAVRLTSRSVVEPEFWDEAAAAGITTLPGVPHTFDLLDRVGFADRDLPPSLRLLTQAGGRMAPEQVRRYALLGQRRGFDLAVMYGATEATARMAVLPPDLAADHPHTVGRAIPGGSLSIEDAGPDGVGAVVFRGPNVMLGYAETPADLARGRDVHALRTGDRGRITPDGLLELHGRDGRVAKVAGIRVDLARLEAHLLAHGVVGYAVAAAGGITVAVDSAAGPVDVERVRALAEASGVPRVRVLALPDLPRTCSGKVDLAALARLADAPPAAGPDAGPQAAPGVAALYTALLGRPAGPEDTFIGLGGDSLSYVEASLRLEKLLGTLPPDWHRRTVAELERGRPDPGREPRRRRTTTVESNVLLRAVAIVAIVGSHANLFMLLGGAHLLVGLAGFNFGRFAVTDHDRRERTRRLVVSLTRIVVPTVLWLGFAVTSAKYEWQNLLLLNGVLGTREWSEPWHYWFVEMLVWTLVALTALLAIPAVDRLERRFPFWLPYGLALLFLLTRYDVVRILGGDYIHRAHVIFWLFALGWAAAKAPTWKHRALVSLTAAATVPGFFEGGQHGREALIVGGFLVLVWVPVLVVPRVVSRVAGVLASASLFIYLCHWQIYPAYEFEMPWLATGLSLAAGIMSWIVVSRVTPRVETAFAGMGHNHPWFTTRRYATRDDRTGLAGAPGAPAPAPGGALG